MLLYYTIERKKAISPLPIKEIYHRLSHQLIHIHCSSRNLSQEYRVVAV